jgi:hypothetical protein
MKCSNVGQLLTSEAIRYIYVIDSGHLPVAEVVDRVGRELPLWQVIRVPHDHLIRKLERESRIVNISKTTESVSRHYHHDSHGHRSIMSLGQRHPGHGPPRHLGLATHLARRDRLRGRRETGRRDHADGLPQVLCAS